MATMSFSTVTAAKPPEPTDFELFNEKYPGHLESGQRLLARLARANSPEHRSAGGYKRNYTSGPSIAGMGGGAANSRGVAIQGKKEGK